MYVARDAEELVFLREYLRNTTDLYFSGFAVFQ